MSSLRALYLLDITKALESWTRLNKSNMDFVEVLSRLVDDYTHDSDAYVKAAELAIRNAPSKVGAYPAGHSTCITV
jgi:hypothetical protein